MTGDSSVRTRPCGKCTDLYRRGAADDVGVTQLTIGIESPRPQRAVGLYGHRGLGGVDTRPRGERADLHRRGAQHYISKTKLARGVCPPRPQRAVGLERKGMCVARRRRTPGGQGPYLDRRGADNDIPQTRLTLGVISPRPKRAVAFYKKGEYRSTYMRGSPGDHPTQLYRRGAIDGVAKS